MYAAREGRAQVIQRLAAAGANVDKQDNRGWTVSFGGGGYVFSALISIPDKVT